MKDTEIVFALTKEKLEEIFKKENSMEDDETLTEIKVVNDGIIFVSRK